MVASPAARPDAIRRHNLALVLGHIHLDGALTRAELTQRLKVSRSTMGALVADLIDLGLVRRGRAHRRVQRRSAVARGRVRTTRGPTWLRSTSTSRTSSPRPSGSAATCSPGRPRRRRSRATPPRTSPTSSWTRCARSRTRPAAPARARRRGRSACPAPSTGAPARSRSRPTSTGTTSRSARCSPSGCPTARRIVVGNDADLSVLAEHRRGVARGVDDVVYLLGRVGVGAGIIVNGVAMRGFDGHAGEIGHNVLDPAGPPCHCGKHGCTETFVGEGALLTAAGRGPAADRRGRGRDLRRRPRR